MWPAAFNAHDAAFPACDTALTAHDVAFPAHDAAFTAQDAAFTARAAAFTAHNAALCIALPGSSLSFGTVSNRILPFIFLSVCSVPPKTGPLNHIKQLPALGL